MFQAVSKKAEPLSRRELARQNAAFAGSGGVSQGNAGQGFRPAFMDARTGVAYLSRFADGRPAPLHLLDGLPETLVAARDVEGRVQRVREGVIAGFLRDGLFFTREQAASAVAHP